MPEQVAATAVALSSAPALAGPVSLMGPQPGSNRDEPTPRTSPSESETAPTDSQGVDAATLQPSSGDEPQTGMWNPDEITGSSMLAGLLMAGGILIIIFILMSRLRRNQRTNQASSMTTREQVAAIRARAGERNNIDAFKADVHDFTRQMAALLDTKAERLEQLIADADERLERLERAQRIHDAPAPPTDEDQSSPLNDAAERRPDPSPFPPRAAPPARRAFPDLETPVSVDPLHDRVYRLADSGLDPVAIARETGQPTGQVELILALRG